MKNKQAFTLNYHAELVSVPSSSVTGFTLIELLVVVLIIGILAAVALPQYQKAVAKSRFAGLKPIAKAVKDAQEIYFETTGDYATSSELDKLDIAIPSDSDVQLSATNSHEYVSVGSTNLDNRYRIYFNHSENFAGNIYCEALTADDPLCIAEGGATGGPTHGSYTLYLLSGNSTGEFPVTRISKQQGGCTLVNMGPYASQCAKYTYSNGTVLDVFQQSNVPERSVQVYFQGESGVESGSYCLTEQCVMANGGRTKLICEDYPFFEGC